MQSLRNRIERKFQPW